MAPIDNATTTTAPLSVVDSATITCVRRGPVGLRQVLRRSELLGSSEVPPTEPMSSAWQHQAVVFGEGAEAVFESGWQVLMGQRMVTNYLRSSPEKLVAMRYPGEYTFPGGALEVGERPDQAALRELAEEFGLRAPQDAQLRLLSVRQTRPVRNRSNVIFNYLLHEDENPWLRAFDVEACNAALAQKQLRLAAQLESGAFWKMSPEDREAWSPEVNEVAWLPVHDAVRIAFLPYVNEYQAAEFARLGLLSRDPVFLTLVTLMEVESFPSLQSFVQGTAGTEFSDARAKAIWLKDGLSPEEVAGVFERRVRSEFTAEHFAALRVERQRAQRPVAAQAVERCQLHSLPGVPT